MKDDAVLEQVSTEPLYQKVAARLRGILSEYKPGDRFLSERVIMARFGVSVMTVRSALAALCQEGLLTRRHGAGTFVAEPARETGLVAVLMEHEPKDDFWSGFVNSISRSLHAEKHSVMVAHVDCTMSIAQHDIDRTNALIDRRPDALIVQGGGHIPFDHIMERRSEIRNLIVFDTDECPPLLDAHRIIFDYEEATYLATAHLLGLGRQNLALLATGRFGYLWQHTAYRQGILRALAEHGLDEGGQTWFMVPPDQGAAPNKMVLWLRDVLQRTNRTDGVVCMRDYLGHLAVRTAKQLGLCVPDDVMVTGMFDTPWSAASDPALTTVYFDVKAMARAITDRLDRTDAFDTVAIAPKLIVRESTGGAPMAESEG